MLCVCSQLFSSLAAEGIPHFNFSFMMAVDHLKGLLWGMEKWGINIIINVESVESNDAPSQWVWYELGKASGIVCASEQKAV